MSEREYVELEHALRSPHWNQFFMLRPIFTGKENVIRWQVWDMTCYWYSRTSPDAKLVVYDSDSPLQAVITAIEESCAKKANP